MRLTRRRDGLSSDGMPGGEAANDSAQRRLRAVVAAVLAAFRASTWPNDLAKPTAQLRDLADLAGVVIAVGLIGLVTEGEAGPVRIVLALAFVVFVPGRAVVANWPRVGYWSEFGASMVLSLAILTFVATVALWVHAWHPVGVFMIEAVLSILALAAGLVRRHQGQRADEAND
jgi:uncharacterized membrane protein